MPKRKISLPCSFFDLPLVKTLIIVDVYIIIVDDYVIIVDDYIVIVDD